MKRIFLTGASSGIGLATAQALLARGDEVWGTSRNPLSVSAHPKFHPVRLDLRDNRNIEEAFNRAIGDAGYFDVVINNAGSGHFGPAELLPLEEVTDQFQVVFFSHVKLMQIALAEMRRRDHGLIINVTSLASLLPVPFMGAYNAAKSAMASFTMSIQLELTHSRIRIVDLQPGDIRTDFNDAVIKSELPNQRYEAKVAKTWEKAERNMMNAPKPDLVARCVCELIDQTSPPPRITVGDAFQTKIAPLIFRFLPQRVRLWGLKRYYGI